VIFGGMISSLILELIVLPVLYVLVNPDKNPS
jgi:multidrug efflux pump subunit AcrB